MAVAHEVTCREYRCPVEDDNPPVIVGVDVLLCEQHARSLEQLLALASQILGVCGLYHAPRKRAIRDFYHYRVAQVSDLIPGWLADIAGEQLVTRHRDLVGA